MSSSSSSTSRPRDCHKEDAYSGFVTVTDAHDEEEFNIIDDCEIENNNEFFQSVLVETNASGLNGYCHISVSCNSNNLDIKNNNQWKSDIEISQHQPICTAFRISCSSSGNFGRESIIIDVYFSDQKIGDLVGKGVVDSDDIPSLSKVLHVGKVKPLVESTSVATP